MALTRPGRCGGGARLARGHGQRERLRGSSEGRVRCVRRWREMGIEQEALPCARVRGGAAGPWAGLALGQMGCGEAALFSLSLIFS